MCDKIEEIREALEGATPGPWVDYSFDGEWFVAFSNYDSGPAVVVKSWPHEREINARLIALAPDMARIVLAAERLAETHRAMLRMLDDALKGTGQGDMAISPDHSLTLIEAWKRDAAYRAAVEGGE